MLNRVQRELEVSHPLSPYKKSNISIMPAKEINSSDQSTSKSNNSQVNLIMSNGFPITSHQESHRRKIQKMLQEVIEKREIRERRISDQELNSVWNATSLFNTQSDNYKNKYKVYNFLNRPKSFWAICYHVLVFIMVFACLIITVFSTIKKFEKQALNYLIMLEKVIIIWFSSEFLLRLWSSSCKKQYQGWKGKFKYLIVPSRVIDIIVIIMSITVMIYSTVGGTRNGHEIFAASAFRGFHRFFSILQILTLNKQLQPWRLISSVIYDQREQLFIIFYIEFIVLCFLAYLAYVVENEQNELFENVADAMWWALVTLSTVGYGDRVPVTWLGKLIASTFIMFSVAIFALPAGIIGTGLALKVEEDERNQQRKKKKWAAAVLLQSTWRCYKANANYLAIAMFFKHKPMDLFAYYDYENVAIKFIRLTKFFIARQKFRELMKPLDIKNLIESYKYGQNDMNSKIKYIQRSIDQMLKRFDINESRLFESHLDVWSKIENFQQLIYNVEGKIDNQTLSIQRFSNNPVLSKDIIAPHLTQLSQNDKTLEDNNRRRNSF